MSALLRAEWLRAASRSFVWFVGVFALFAALGVGVIAWNDTRPPSEAEIASLRADFDVAHQYWVEHGDEQLAHCEAHIVELQEKFPDDAAVATLTCDGVNVEPRWADYLPEQPGFAELGVDHLRVLTWLVVLAGFAVGTSLVTAEFASGSMGTWLTFAPRRSRVFASKALAAVGVGALLGAAIVVVGTGAVVVAFAANGVLRSPSAEVWGSVAAVVGRQAALGVAFAAVGAGLAFALRHAAAVTGLVVWWVVAVESVLPMALPVATPVAVHSHVAAWAEAGYTYTLPACVWDPQVGEEVCTDVEHVVTMAQGAGALAATAVFVLFVGAWVFRRRDVA